jgi:hypothetical protein
MIVRLGQVRWGVGYIFSVVTSQILRVDIDTLEVRDFLRQYSQQLRIQNLKGYRQALQSCVLR